MDKDGDVDKEGATTYITDAPSTYYVLDSPNTARTQTDKNDDFGCVGLT